MHSSLAMLYLLLQFSAASLLSWVLWTIFRQIIVRSTLDNVAGPPSESLLKGNLEQLYNPNAWQFHKQIAEQYGGVVKMNGMLGDKQLYVFDPKALHHIVVKEQDIYGRRPAWIAQNRLLFGMGLLSTSGDYHRKQRKLLNHVFSINHMRNMVPGFYEVSHKLREALDATLAGQAREINVLDWMNRTALELIGQSGLGYSFDALNADSPNPYCHSVKNLLPTIFSVDLIIRLLPWVVKIGSPKFRRFLLEITPWKKLQDIREMVDIMENTSIEVLEAKKRALAKGDEAVLQQVGHGKDIMSILLKANMEASEEDRLPESELVGHMSTLIFTAMDTTSGALAHIMHLLAEHPDVQEKVRQEIADARKVDSDLSYDDLVDLPYLDAVCRETLRLHPPVPFVARITTQDTVLPLSKPVRGVDGKEIHEIIVPKDTDVILGMVSSNRDPTTWGPDAGEWKPERWLSPLPESIIEAHVPGVYWHTMTFLGGQRACIGFKFSQLEMKAVLSVVLGSFKFSLSDHEIFWNMGLIQTPTVKGSKGYPQLPLKLEPIQHSKHSK